MSFGSPAVADLRQQVADNPYEYQNWENLLRELGSGAKSDERTAALREVYENVVTIFPTTCAFWKEYCQFEIENGDEATIKGLFGKCLLMCLDIELWGMYVGYIKSLHDASMFLGQGGEEKETSKMVEEYKNCLEFALERVGQDVRAGGLWEEYFELLTSVQEGSAAYEAVFGQAVEGQEDAAKTAALRRAMHRAILIPTTSLDSIWSRYESFENSLGNKQLAKRSLDEWRPKYHASKAVCHERYQMVESLDTNILPLPPGKGGRHQMEEAEKWRKYCHWEQNNPGEADKPAHQARVVLAYEQSLGYFIQFPDIWLDYASWHLGENGMGVEAAVSVLDRGREALPAALVLHFQVADLHEQSGNIDKARSIYEDITSEESILAGEDEDDEAEAINNDLKTLAWIQYMRFVRRVDGIMAARKLFMRARKWTGLQWQAFVASARFEWLNEGKDNIPRNIFELGMKTFGSTPEYVLEYAKFLIGLGDLANTRSLFERALTTTTAEDSGPLWDCYISFEAESGSLSTVLSLESRRRGMLTEAVDDPLDSMHVSLLKYKFMDVFPGQEDMFEVSPDMFNGYDEEEFDGQDVGFPQPPPPPSAYPPPPPLGGPRVPRDLHQLMKQLYGEAEGPVPDVEHILTPIMNFEFSVAGIEAHEAAMGRPLPSPSDIPARKPMPNRNQNRRHGGGRGGKRKSHRDPPVSMDSRPAAPPDDDDVLDNFDAGSDVYRRRMRKRT